jgi:hypothetical protein
MIFKFFKRMFSRQPKQVVENPLEDPLYAEVVRRCWDTGNVVIGNRLDDNTFEIKEIDNKQGE